MCTVYVRDSPCGCRDMHYVYEKVKTCGGGHLLLSDPLTSVYPDSCHAHLSLCEDGGSFRV